MIRKSTGTLRATFEEKEKTMARQADVIRRMLLATEPEPAP
jgi:hypothetical protein